MQGERELGAQQAEPVLQIDPATIDLVSQHPTRAGEISQRLGQAEPCAPPQGGGSRGEGVEHILGEHMDTEEA